MNARPVKQISCISGAMKIETCLMNIEDRGDAKMLIGSESKTKNTIVKTESQSKQQQGSIASKIEKK